MKIMVCAFALSMVATAADAQFSPLPGFIPYEVNAPAAAAGANQMGEGPCVWESRGRGGIHSTCEDQNPPQQRR
jgi:hypothetical protein